jgi:hypothetical protein
MRHATFPKHSRDFGSGDGLCAADTGVVFLAMGGGAPSSSTPRSPVYPHGGSRNPVEGVAFILAVHRIGVLRYQFRGTDTVKPQEVSNDEAHRETVIGGAFNVRCSGRVVCRRHWWHRQRRHRRRDGRAGYWHSTFRHDSRATTRVGYRKNPGNGDGSQHPDGSTRSRHAREVASSRRIRDGNQ